MSLAIYAKERGNSKDYFRGFDLENNCIASSEGYVSLIPENRKEIAEEIIKELEVNYPNWIYKLDKAFKSF